MYLTISIYFIRFQLLKFKPILKRQGLASLVLVRLFFVLSKFCLFIRTGLLLPAYMDSFSHLLALCGLEQCFPQVVAS